MKDTIVTTQGDDKIVFLVNNDEITLRGEINIKDLVMEDLKIVMK